MGSAAVGCDARWRAGYGRAAPVLPLGERMTTADRLDRGREAFGRRAWTDAYAQLVAADHESSLGPEDLERLATVAHLVGRDADSAVAWERAHHACKDLGDAARAARCAFWLAVGLLNRGETARAGGWLARAQRLIDERRLDCAEQGYLLMPVGLRSSAEGDFAAAYTTFGKVAEIGNRFGDRDLMVFGRHGQGRALIRMENIAEGLALLDESMIAVTAGEVSPILTGMVYCSVIEICQEIFDLRRAQEWTAELSRWCMSQPDLVPYRGQCLVHRSQIMQLHGAWRDAMDEAQRACERLSTPPGQPLGMALYQQAELHRLRGEFVQAEAAYRQANQVGRQPQPGIALLRLAQGRVDAAQAGIRRMMEESHDRVTRFRVLAAYVEIMLAANDVNAARDAVNELSELAASINAPFLHAVSCHATGAVLVAEGDSRAALETLRHAWRAWQELEAPYEAARVRVLAGLACRELGDEDGAEMELDAARSVFQELGAAPDLARVEGVSRTAALTRVGGLTAREVQVLGLVAAGKTNREIAVVLVVSEHPVRRHVQNIFAKVGVSSRAAATAYAFKHDLA
jgi:DNA-binding CsgD family transcriptional regulator/tetratricopeptide (TPR) repeat protein